MTPRAVTRDSTRDTCVSHGTPYPYPTRPDPNPYIYKLAFARRGLEIHALHSVCTADAMPDLATIDHLDWSQACQSHLGCDRPAEWLLTVTCCNRGALLCDDHLLRWVRHERAVIAQGSAECWNCRRFITNFKDFARMERL